MRPANQQPPSSFPAEPGGHLPLALLRQYVAGTLPPTEQHRVEAHTLDCERCADVLEGLSVSDAETTEHAISQLHTRLKARLAQEAPQRTAGAWQRLAAVVALLVVAGALLWLGLRQPMNSRSAETAAVVRPRAVPKASAPLATKKAAPEYAAAPPTQEADLEALSSTQSSPIRAPRPLSRRKNAADAATPTGEATGLADAVASASMEAKEAPVAVAAPDSAAIGGLAAAPMKAKSSAAFRTQMSNPTANSQGFTGNTRRISGRIIDKQNGAGLPGATIQVKGTSIGASTAADGSFSIAVPKGEDKLTVSSIGYETQEHKLNRDSTFALALSADNKALNEVVVTAVPNSRMPAPPPVAPAPVGGFTAYHEYLKRELKYPDKALEQHLEGSVKLKFTVTAAGTIEDVKVLDSLSPECDQEAIRLVQEGPTWLPGTANGRRAARTVKVTVSFRID
ncbi:TonB family protein [Hymenobacter jejuensis]|uniref:TonB family protein n=1 Tax=Hymenobacter jejuensis TaxID=2502781 RepID=A0A5B8A0C6_9BACT|nr:TonB family protein [Hymenobacter jejuensis]QDA60105.1 TonB family protein [Hymenobacter jejuensis]